MKSIFSILTVLVLASVSFAQSPNYSDAIDDFQTHYNAGAYDQIFEQFSAEMKQNLPLESTRQFLSGLKGQVGKMESKEFIQYEQGSYASYKTRFENATLSVNISLDSLHHINGLFIKPYEEIAESASSTINALSGFPKPIATSIFTKARVFPDHTQLSIALIQNGKTHYYGIIKEQDSIKPIDNENKIFEIGSITKVFTATVLASLVEDNKLKLTDYINDLYPFPFKGNVKITFESLANHTSGLPRLPQNLDLSNETNPYKDYGKKELYAYLKNLLKTEHPVSTSYAYSNLGAGLLGYTLGLAQKTSFQQLVQKRIFDKYHMSQSFTHSQRGNNHLVKGRDSVGTVVSNWDFDALFGGGGILSTTADLAKFADAQFNPANKALSLTRKPTFTINEHMKIGLGWHILKSENGKDIYWHNGGTGGYSSSMAVNTETRTAVIILSNVSAFNPKMANIDKLCFELLDNMDEK